MPEQREELDRRGRIKGNVDVEVADTALEVRSTVNRLEASDHLRYGLQTDRML